MSWLSAGLRVFQERSARVLTFVSHTEFHIPLSEKIDVKRIMFEVKDQVLIVKSPTPTIKSVKLDCVQTDSSLLQSLKA